MKEKLKFLLVLSLLFILTACSSSYNGGRGTASQSAPAAPAAAAPEAAAGRTNDAYYSELESKEWQLADEAFNADTGGSAMPVEEVRQNKIIFTGNIYMETNQFDSVLDSIQSVLNTSGGYVASSNLYNYKQIQSVDYRTYNVTLKVPVKSYKETFAYLKTLGKVLSSDESADDVTGQYYDMESRLGTKKIEEERVLDMISRATKIEDLIALERRLGELRTDIELYETRLRNLERLTSYSTINMTVNEIDEGEILSVSDDLGVRIRKSFASSVNGTLSFFENLILFLTFISIPLVIILMMGFVVFVIYKMSRRNTRPNMKKEE